MFFSITYLVCKDKIINGLSATNDMNMGKMKMMEEKCEVRNLTCVKFPTVKQCQGIGMGGCLCK